MARRAEATVGGVAFIAAFWAVAAAQQPAVGTPEEAIVTLHRGLIEAAARAPASVAERERLLGPIVDATHDLAYIAEFTIRRQWPALGDADRQRFVAAFRTLSVRTYASRFGVIDERTFATEEAVIDDDGRATVRAAIHRAEGGDIPLEYLLQQRDGRWRIINIIADGVSDLALKRAEYQRVLASGSIDDLIAELERQAGRLE
jgi:phospholipid transport system substrate-binding protein